MKLIEKKLYLEFQELIECGVSLNTLKKASERKSNGWDMLADPSDKRKVLVGFDGLKENYKELVRARYENPYEYVAKAPIKKLVTKDVKAEEYFLTLSLKDEQVQNLTTAASWLNMLVKMTTPDGKKTIRKELKLTWLEFIKAVSSLIKTDEIDLPASYKHLSANIKSYAAEGYSSLIHGNTGKRNAAKIVNELCDSVLNGFIEHPNKFDDTRVCLHYNKWAKENNYKTIDVGTVKIYRRKNAVVNDMTRLGSGDWYEKHSTVIKGKRPSCPLALVENDDNDLDMYFSETVEKKGKGGKVHKFTDNYKRVKMIVVTDTCDLDYPLGWAYGDTVSVELVKAAWLDAMHHIKELTGNYYLPHQIKNDRWGMTALQPFYESIDSDFFKTAAHSKRAKLIEQSFGKRWHQELKEVALLNYAGTNIVSRSRINSEALDANVKAKNIPHISEAPVYISAFIEKIRNRKLDNGNTIQEEWKRRFFESEISQERQIGMIKFLNTFGTKHIVKSARRPEYPNTITNEGVVLNIGNEEYTYEVPEEIRAFNKGKKVQVVYDIMDMSRVLVTDGEGLRFIAEEPYLMPKARVDYKDGDNERYWAKMHEKKRLVNWVSEQVDKRKGILAANQISIEGRLQAGLLLKEDKQLTEGLYHRLQASVTELENVEPEEFDINKAILNR